MHPLEVILPFLIAGIGACFTGLIFDHVQDWEVFAQIDELFIIMPALLGLKGNLQLTLASRLSTQYQLGNVQDLSDMLKLTSANMALNQCFSNVVSFIAALLCILVKSISMAAFLETEHCLLLISVSMLTSSLVSFLLDILMILIIQVSSYLNINPDNVASPLASALGDMTAIILCTFLADLLFTTMISDVFYWFTACIIIFYFLMIPVWIWMSLDEPHTRKVLLEVLYWYPLLAAMLLSSLAGVIFKSTVGFSDDIALFAPVICATSGNVAAVQASRISTLLHKDCQVGELPPGEKACSGPWNLFVSNSPGYNVTRLLIAIIVPGQILFYFFCIVLDGRLNNINAIFTVAYLIGSFVQSTTLIYLAYRLTYFLWINKIDPDSCSIPYLTSIGDLLGACFVTGISFVIVPPEHRDFGRSE